MNRREREFQDWPECGAPCPMLSGSGSCVRERGHTGPHQWPEESRECRVVRDERADGQWDQDTEDERRESEYAGWFSYHEQTWLDRGQVR